MKPWQLIALIAVLFFSNQNREKEYKIPKGAFPIKYHGHLYIEGEINGIKGNYVFDTGASNLYIDSTHYANNNFKHDNTFVAYLPGAGNSRQKVNVIKDPVEIIFGHNLYKTTTVPIFQLKPILGDIADGIIGINYFKNKILEINYEKEYMQIHSSIDSLDLRKWTKIKLTLKNNQLYLPAETVINDSIKISGNYILDLGSGGSVCLTSSIAKKYNLNHNIKNKAAFFTKYGGVGGESSNYDFFAQQLKIGNFYFDNVLMNYSTDSAGALASERYLGLLGNEIFEKFHIIIDFINQDLYLKPNKSFDKKFKSPKLGFSYVNRCQTLDSWIVRGLFASSNAEKSGLRIDDRIISVNGINVKEIDLEKEYSMFKNLDEITLGIKRNEKLIEMNFSIGPII